MSIYLQLHPVSPQRRFVRQAVEVLRGGGVIVYPTDSCYALGCHIGDKAALERIRSIRQTDRNHHFTLVCRDLADVGKYALVENWQYRLLRAHTPGPYTFLLKASRETPRRLKHERRGTIGVLGSTRMAYAQVGPRVRYVAQRVGRAVGRALS